MTPYENGLMTIPQCGKTLQIWTMAHLLIYIYYIHIHINFGPYTYIHYITLHTPISRWLLILSSSIAGLPNAWFDHLEEWNHPWPTTSWIGSMVAGSSPRSFISCWWLTHSFHSRVTSCYTVWRFLGHIYTFYQTNCGRHGQQVQFNLIQCPHTKLSQVIRFSLRLNCPIFNQWYHCGYAFRFAMLLPCLHRDLGKLLMPHSLHEVLGWLIGTWRIW